MSHNEPTKVANTPEKADKDFRTYNQWVKLGYLPLPEFPGTLMYTNGFKVRRLLYWAANEVRPGTPEEMEEIHNKQREKRKEQQRQAYQKRKEKEKAEQEYMQRVNDIELAYKRKAYLLEEAAQLPIIPCHNPCKIVVFDLETTGLDPDEDEILQIAIIDGDGNTLINTLVKPYLHTDWCDAEMIHGISPAMVADMPQLHELIPVIKGIFESADLVVSYNGAHFDAAFLAAIGIDISHITHFDVMHEFAPVYGVWDENRGSYRWQSLTTCANYYGYSLSAHDALEDCKATLHCYKELTKPTN